MHFVTKFALCVSLSRSFTLSKKYKLDFNLRSNLPGSAQLAGCRSPSLAGGDEIRKNFNPTNILAKPIFSGKTTHKA